jgi:hypothetical protein
VSQKAALDNTLYIITDNAVIVAVDGTETSF